MLIKMANLPSIFATINLVFLLDTLLIHQSSSTARNLDNQTPPTHRYHHHNQPKIKFLMQDVLNISYPSPKPATTEITSPIPFPKPLGYFPPYGGIPLPESNPTASATRSPTHFDFSSIGVQFPARAAVQGMELGSVIGIDEHLFEATMYGESVVGKARGIFVAGSEDGASHMVALTANFGRIEFKDGLRFFGAYKKDGPESHIAVIGGIGKFDGANGYAVIKSVDKSNKLLSFNVYLS